MSSWERTEGLTGHSGGKCRPLTPINPGPNLQSADALGPAHWMSTHGSGRNAAFRAGSQVRGPTLPHPLPTSSALGQGTCPFCTCPPPVKGRHAGCLADAGSIRLGHGNRSLQTALINHDLYSHGSGAWESRIKVPAGQGGEGPLPGSQTSLFAALRSPHTVGGWEHCGLPVGIFTLTTSPPPGGPTSNTLGARISTQEFAGDTRMLSIADAANIK